MQFQADILNVIVERPAITETTALGAAFLAGLAAGYWENQQELMEMKQIERFFQPSMTDEKRSSLLAGWEKAIASTLSTSHLKTIE